MILRKAIPYTLAMALTAPWLSAADAPQTPPESTLLVARDVPQSAAPAPSTLRVVGLMVNEGTCWQVAKLCSQQVPAQVFFCVVPASVSDATVEPTRKVPPILPKG